MASSLTELIFGIKHAKIGIVQLDASVTETHSDEAEVTDHPVEDGSTVSDHIRKRPPTLQINGMVTSTPLVFLASLTAKSPLTTDIAPSADRPGDAYAELLRVMDEGKTVDVVTTLREYKTMAITGLSVMRDAPNGQVLNFSITLRQIVMVSPLKTGGVPIPDSPANRAIKNQGKKAKQQAEQKVSESALSMLLGL